MSTIVCGGEKNIIGPTTLPIAYYTIIMVNCSVEERDQFAVENLFLKIEMDWRYALFFLLCLEHTHNRQ
ncbi:hypothetical protein [Pareuzebyella sediminis]|uniref:hypothetical protein n=1 Tax=Pareuzebyella sediminis TaxID=2607998 RepID=UPI0011EC694E|nr:hypothetical protein [Pareuzebyella sediminis]